MFVNIQTASLIITPFREVNLHECEKGIGHAIENAHQWQMREEAPFSSHKRLPKEPEKDGEQNKFQECAKELDNEAIPKINAAQVFGELHIFLFL
jgi:hypothetical protein